MNVLSTATQQVIEEIEQPRVRFRSLHGARFVMGFRKLHGGVGNGMSNRGKE